MNFDAYQKKAHITSKSLAVGGNTWIYPALGLSNEAGEALGKLKKILRDKDGVISAEDQAELASELGDTLWYLSELALQLNIPLNVVAKENLKKVLGRKKRGTLHGSGDHR